MNLCAYRHEIVGDIKIIFIFERILYWKRFLDLMKLLIPFICCTKLTFRLQIHVVFPNYIKKNRNAK